MDKKLSKIFLKITLVIFVLIASYKYSNVFNSINKKVYAQSSSDDVYIQSYKVVCETEEDLPNWGEGGNNRPDEITHSTAQEYVNNSNGSCHLESNWKFQWGFGNNNSTELEGVHKLPGDHLGSADGTLSDCYFQCGDNTNTGDNYDDWKDFDTETSNNGELPAGVKIKTDFEIPGIWVRESLKKNYIPFSYPPYGSFENNKTAELYCHKDIRNYDNYDYIYNPQPGKTYYCVAFNVLLGRGIDLTIIKDDGKEEVVLGQEILYKIIVKNIGDRAATGVKVTDTLPTELELIENPSNASVNNNVLIWNIAELDVDEEITLEVKARVKNINVEGENAQIFTTIANYAQVEDDGKNGPDINPDNNYAEDLDQLKTTDSPILKLTKTNNKLGQKLKKGENVVFTLTLEAFEDIENVRLVDLPAEGFEYIKNSWNGTSSELGDMKANNTLAEPTYSSPGTWAIGSMKRGETVTVSYVSSISKEVDPGTYKDMAWARGYYLGGLVLANDHIDNLDTFVGTNVEVIEENPTPKTDVDIKVEEIVKIQEVLAAADTRLPDTGISNFWMILILTCFVTGFVLLGFALIDYLNAKYFIIFLGAIVSISLTNSFNSKVFAAESFEIRVETPKNSTNGEFEIGFVALDINSNSMTMKCLVKKPGASDFGQFGNDITLKNGGDSANCSVTQDILNTEGDYTFKIEGNTGIDIKHSNEVFVSYDSKGPGKPKWIKKELKNGCRYEVTFKTASDYGNTNYVEIYRDTANEFEANKNTRIKTVSIGSDEIYTFEDELNAEECKETPFYALRSFDNAGNFSKIRTEEDIETVEIKEVEILDNTSSLGLIDTLQNEDNNEKIVIQDKNRLGIKIDEKDNGNILGQKSLNENIFGTKDIKSEDNDKPSFPWLLLLPLVFIGIYMIMRRKDN